MGTFILSYLQTKRYGKEALTEDEKKGKMFRLTHQQTFLIIAFFGFRMR